MNKKETQRFLDITRSTVETVNDMIDNGTPRKEAEGIMMDFLQYMLMKPYEKETA